MGLITCLEQLDVIHLTLTRNNFSNRNLRPREIKQQQKSNVSYGQNHDFYPNSFAPEPRLLKPLCYIQVAISKSSHDFLTHVFTLSCNFMFIIVVSSISKANPLIKNYQRNFKILRHFKVTRHSSWKKNECTSVHVYVTRRKR